MVSHKWPGLFSILRNRHQLSFIYMLNDLEEFSTDGLLDPHISNLVFPLWPTVFLALDTMGQVLNAVESCTSVLTRSADPTGGPWKPFLHQDRNNELTMHWSGANHRNISL